MVLDQWGKCGICGRLAEPAQRCRMCGATTCVKCFATAIGLCRTCSRKVNAGTALKDGQDDY
jgi:hypothetical protein